ncbi:unnamed protein product [Cylindrotheca closterium]|uniref:Uncharacterized protein n=1 Tax=Cylindrotheca closterium TaxID=2856 RepID=A0AAD2PU30_9STRA|nr:unnamed protein product [Cylindrotheca closterium]
MNNGHTTKHRHRRIPIDTCNNGAGNESSNHALPSPNSVSSTRASSRRRVKKKPKTNFRVVILVMTLPLAVLPWLFAHSNMIKPTSPFLRPEKAKPISIQASADTLPHQLQDLEPLRQPIDQIREEWPDLLHIVNTRFMQEQGTLKTLGMARYHQFMTFCFPSMMNQTTTEFLWIVKTDPELSPEIRDLMIEAMKPYPHFYLVGSNNNFMINKNNGSWKGGEEGKDLLNSTIFTGNLTWLQQAMALRNELPVLETRLDADDGLHQMYLDYVQGVARRRFDKDDDSSAPDWLYWCIRRHLEWHTPADNTTDPFLLERGILIPIQHSLLCITPGITVGYNVRADPTKIPVYPHDALLLKLSHRDANNQTAHNCYPPGKAETESDEETDSLPCLDMAEAFLLGALRSRTWTSAGMMRVEADAQVGSPEVIRKLWLLLHKRFAVEPERVKELMKYFEANRKEIAQENLLGQCTTGHSCKDSAKQALQSYMGK